MGPNSIFNISRKQDRQSFITNLQLNVQLWAQILTKHGHNDHLGPEPNYAKFSDFVETWSQCSTARGRSQFMTPPPRSNI